MHMRHAYAIKMKFKYSKMALLILFTEIFVSVSLEIKFEQLRVVSNQQIR